ncbi:alpha-mannosidase [Laspinema olomoucense]|uniref:alpha-mannosidase n=1 Tax=Laspinema olomoucense TaxID=3231600 RepID=UPI0021BAA8F1|nr:alpha-mannosidase [Laspinema sp. D3a]MCT7991324.1 alpha-mannosidase [Laspinema sp. D3a]
MPDPNSEITRSIEKLRQLTRVNAIGSWRYRIADLSVEEGTAADTWDQWQRAELNEKGHIPWTQGHQTIWLGLRYQVPDQLQGYPVAGLTLRLALTWWADEAQIFVNGELVQEGDLFDCVTRVMIEEEVEPGQGIDIALRLVSPGHDCGALVRSLWIYEKSYEDSYESCIDPGFIADELAVIGKYWGIASDAETKLQQLQTQMEAIAWDSLPDDVPKFEQSLSELRTNLKQQFHQTSKLCLLGHAHLDLAWLWPIAETWDAAEFTFASVLDLMAGFPHLTFGHSTAALYAWIEDNCPELFADIQAEVAAGRWEVLAGLWVEPELNIISGEAICRQLLYGQQYCLEKFGKLSPVAWLPDTFGFCGQLPQFLKQGGIEYFVTQKLRWNDTTEFPYPVFWWESPDGTRIFSLMSAPIGTGIEPVQMADYACDWEQKTGLKESLWLPGVGDHGGGPTRDMLEVGDRWRQSPFFPAMEFTTAEDYLRQLQQQREFPVWRDELYLEFHRGCYTTHGDQKQWNRRCEGLLYEAELWAAIATRVTGSEYPKGQIEAAWKAVLFNQFHDILPGSSIPEVYQDANLGWQEAEENGREVLEQAFAAIASQVAGVPPAALRSAQPIMVFNSLNWQRSQIVSLELPEPAATGMEWQVYNSEGNPVRSQLTPTHLLFECLDIPSIGYHVFWLGKSELNPNSSSPEPKDEFILENTKLRVIIDPETGNLSSIYDKINDWEILREPGNQLQAFEDQGQYWDAWNIDPNYSQHPLPPPTLKQIQWIERDTLQQRVQVIRQVGQSDFIQEYIIQADSPLLKIATTVNWQDRHIMVKAAFPLTIEADFFTSETPCAAVERTTRPQTPEEKAKWEVPALKWADLSGEQEGVSLLNDSKYGYDATPNQLRLTLLRGSTWPDPEADLGWHHFTYCIYPYRGNWQSAKTVRQGYELNLPLQVRLLESVSEPGEKTLHLQESFLQLSGESLVLMAFKQSESDATKWIMRCYESEGKPTELAVQEEWKSLQEVDLLEENLEEGKVWVKGEVVPISPWKVASFQLGIEG